MSSLNIAKNTKCKIKNNDNVIVIAGSHKGMTGEVIKVDPRRGRVMVKGVALVKRHTKPSQVSEGGIVSKNAFIDASNVKKVN